MRLPLFGQKEKEGTEWDVWIGNQIREARQKKGWTQGQLAEAIEKSQGNISDIERGNIAISAVDLMYIGINLETPITFFFPPRAVMAGPNDLNDREKELIHYIDDMSEDFFDLLMQQAKSYRDITATKVIERTNREMAADRVERQAKQRGKRARGKK